MKIFNSQFSIILWKGTHNLNQRKKMKTKFGMGNRSCSIQANYIGSLFQFNT